MIIIKNLLKFIDSCKNYDYVKNKLDIVFLKVQLLDFI